MQLFYDPDISSGNHELSASEARHAVQVLRKKAGDTLDIVDGRGGWFAGEILEAGKKRCWLEVRELRREERRAAFRTVVAIAPTKAGDRFEWFLEKATEIGIDAIQPIITHHSERRKIRPERLRKVLETAMKQSLQAWLPELLPLKDFSGVISTVASDGKYLAWIDEKGRPDLSKAMTMDREATILIGPEGGFSDEEVEEAIGKGFLPVSLGPNRLRTETAGVVAVQILETRRQRVK